ncbi:aromatic ring-hydroxylating dioxygenase subunit alpha [Streptomyces sp. NPDC048479]|uniref:aromatic ring-hydroxylating oxygenase subunit alpha n=1 Tax=Streptomyces sp. NPDC048479 TaxID=3154725 RepID=UPI00343275A5
MSTATPAGADFENLAQGLKQGRGLPLSWYTGQGILDLEQQRLFRASWQYIGSADQVREPGQFVTAEVAGIPVVIVRDNEGTLNAFHNICRHRAAQVIQEPAGKRRTLQCHYHAWTYGLDGSLKAAPRSDRESCFAKEQLGLLPAQAATWGPFLFAHLDPAAAPLMEALGGVPRLVAEAGVDVERLRHHQRVDYELGCNWKVAIENYLECYHCTLAHPGLSDVMDTRQDAYRLTVDHGFAWQNGPLKPKATPPAGTGYHGQDGEVPEGRYFTVWPSLKININPGLANVSIGPMLPLGPDRCLGQLDYFFGEDVSEEWIDEMYAFDNQVGAEDRGLVESVQRGIVAGALDHGRIMLAAERLVAGFHEYVLARLEGL